MAADSEWLRVVLDEAQRKLREQLDAQAGRRANRQVHQAADAPADQEHNEKKSA